jgi:RimJ/RimL family protein N-acetyltransferase
MAWVVGPLTGRFVRLEPLDSAHVPLLVQAAAENRDTYEFALVPEGQEAMAAHVAGLLADRDRSETVPFVQVRPADGAPVGMTRFLNIRTRPGATTPYAVEVGGTWLAASAQRTGINAEAKLLLMTYAFDEWKVGRLDIKTDVRNQRSRHAIAGIGGTFEGVLRGWQPSQVEGEEDRLRDTAMFSIVRAEWPEVQARLRARLRAGSPGAPAEPGSN